MKRIAVVILLAVMMDAAAEHGPVEPPLSLEQRQHLIKTLGDIFEDGDITSIQYERSLYWVNATPCDGVDRSLSDRARLLWEEAVAKQQVQNKVEVYKVFQRSGWYILYSNAGAGDNPYFFYSANPKDGAVPLAVWSGAATIFETEELAEWAKQSVPGMPEELATCFAWHVTLSPE